MRKCTCIRCKAKDYVFSIFPEMDDRRALLAAEKIVKALRESIAETNHMRRDVSTPGERS